MKIVYFYRGVPVSTPLMHIRFIIAALRAQGHEVVECFPAVGETDQVRPVDQNAVARAKGWFRAHMPRPVVNLAQLYEARRARSRLLAVCRRTQPDFIYERYSIFTDAGLRAARAVGCPLIQEVNAVYSQQHEHVFAPGFRALARQADRRLLPQADALIAVSGVVAEALRACGVPAERITVMHNAVAPAEYAGLEEKRRMLRGSLGLGDRPVAVVLQALDAGPFPENLLEALKEMWPAVRAAAPGARLLWIGGGSRYQWFRERVAAEVRGSEEEIVFVGARPHAEVPGLLACGDLGLVLWHRAFCSPMKIFEYLAAGLPVVAPDLAGVSEVIRNGGNGILFRNGDFAGLAEQVISLLRDRERAASLARQGHEDVMRHHTWEANAAEVVEIARRLISTRSPAPAR